MVSNWFFVFYRQLQMSRSYRSNVVAVVVTYQPKLGVLGQLLDALTSQVKSIVLVDNGSQVDLEAWNTQRQSSAVEVLLLGENQGIAVAHNVGIKWAQNNAAEFVLLMDQDSIPAPDMVQMLTFTLLEMENKSDFKPIAAGPICIDMRNAGKSIFVTERNGIPTRYHPVIPISRGSSSVEVVSLISSGTLINLKALWNVGGMRSNYFIDHVDTEWCFRARAKGYSLLGVPSAQMQHTLGDKVENFWFFGWRQVAYHSPLRDYYMFRNTLLMCRDVEMSVIWRLHLIFRLVKFSSYFLIFTHQRAQRFYCMALGILHGFRGVSGKVDLKTGQCTQIPKSDLDP